MAVFTEKVFIELMDKLLVIHPLRQECITGVGYDLTIGFFIKVNRQNHMIEEIRETDGNGQRKIILEPDRYLVVVTREFVYLSSRLSATFHSMSRLSAQAVLMNSTTGDPNWNGRLIFSLFNASGSRVELDKDLRFATMVVHTVSHPSTLMPKNPHEVLTKYLQGFEGDASPAISYVLRDDEVRAEYETKKERAKKFANRYQPLFLISLLIAQQILPRKRQIRLLSLALFVVLFAYIAIYTPASLQVGVFSERSLTITGSICSILSALWLLVGGIRSLLKDRE